MPVLFLFSVRPVDWVNTSLSNLPVLPENKIPVTSWRDQDEAFSKIAEGIRKAIEGLKKPVNGPPDPQYYPLRTDKHDIIIKLSSPTPIIGRQVTVDQSSIIAQGRVEGLPFEASYKIAGYVAVSGAPDQRGSFCALGVDGSWKISNILLDLDVGKQRIFFRIFDKDHNEIAESDEIKIARS